MAHQMSKPYTRSTSTAQRDASLQIARRIDWRFLLPNPRLGHVAYIGPSHRTLLPALDQFSTSLTHVSLSDQIGLSQSAPASFELVIVHSQSLAAVQKAHTLLMTDGYLYWEIDRRGGFAPLCGLTQRREGQKRWIVRPVHHNLAVLERLGFGNIEVHWHRPSFESCHEILPLYDRCALAYMFSQQREGLADRIRLVAGRFLLETGWLPWCVPCVSIVACKRPVRGAIT
jgi:hypothetical protein